MIYRQLLFFFFFNGLDMCTNVLDTTKKDFKVHYNNIPLCHYRILIVYYLAHMLYLRIFLHIFCIFAQILPALFTEVTSVVTPECYTCFILKFTPSFLSLP